VGHASSHHSALQHLKVLLAQHVGRTNGLFQKSAVTGNIREYVLQHFHNLNEDRQNIHHLHLAGNHFYNVTDFTAQYSDLEERNFAKLQRSNVDDLVRVSGSAVDGNTRIKYGTSVLQQFVTSVRMQLSKHVQNNWI
jgi:hypothetical protein